MEESVVEITMTGRIPVFLVVVSAFGAREESFLVDARIARLVESGDADLLVGVFLDNAEGVVVSVERRHEDERDIDTVGGVQVLDLADGEVEEGHVLLNLKGTLRTGHAWFIMVKKLIIDGVPNAPIEVPRPPFTLRTASLLKLEESLGLGRLA